MLGAREGTLLGNPLDTWDGVLLGKLEGILLGSMLGIVLGRLDGMLLGCMLGIVLGATVESVQVTLISSGEHRNLSSDAPPSRKASPKSSIVT